MGRIMFKYTKIIIKFTLISMNKWAVNILIYKNCIKQRILKLLTGHRGLSTDEMVFTLRACFHRLSFFSEILALDSRTCASTASM